MEWPLEQICTGPNAEHRNLEHDSKAIELTTSSNVGHPCTDEKHSDELLLSMLLVVVHVEKEVFFEWRKFGTGVQLLGPSHVPSLNK